MNKRRLAIALTVFYLLLIGTSTLMGAFTMGSAWGGFLEGVLVPLGCVVFCYIVSLVYSWVEEK